MKWYWVRTRKFIKRLLPGYVWDLPGKSDTVYLTFDDGPTPETTHFVLELLERYGFQATFFCIGKNVQDNPEIFADILSAGHAVGNHTHDHPNGWETSFKSYIENIRECEIALGGSNTGKLFRPPYGKLTPAQFREVKKMGYRIVMWDVLSADFDTSVSPSKCLNNVLRNIRAGSIVIFHDSEKAAPNLRHALPATLEYLKNNGFKSAAIT